MRKKHKDSSRVIGLQRFAAKYTITKYWSIMIEFLKIEYVFEPQFFIHDLILAFVFFLREYGVLQLEIFRFLDLILFSLYINTNSFLTECNIYAYADDIVLYTIIQAEFSFFFKMCLSVSSWLKEAKVTKVCTTWVPSSHAWINI